MLDAQVDGSHDVWCTDDADEARSVLSSVYAPHDLTVRGKRKFGFSLQLLNTAQLTVGYSRFDTDVLLEVPPPSSFYVLCFAPAGAVEACSGRRSTVVSPKTATVLTPNMPWRFGRWTEGSNLMAMRISRADLEEDLSALLGRRVERPIEFADELDLANGNGREFAQVLRLLQSEVGRPSNLAQQHSSVAAHLGQLVRSAMLVSQPHSYSEALQSDRRQAGVPTAIRRVVDAVEADPMQVRSAADVARIACLSLRALERGFERNMGMSPMTYIRQVRLARARNDLVNGSPEVLTVSMVAARWGFGHPGRFATAYQQRYGESPSQTLQRGS